MQLTYGGDAEIVLDTPRFEPPLTDDECLSIAQAFVHELQDSARRRLPEPLAAGLHLQVVAATYGCVRAKWVVRVASALVGTYTFVAMWGDFRTSLKALLEDVGAGWQCVVRQQLYNCPLRDSRLRITDHLYKIKSGDKLSRIVIDEFKIPSGSLDKAMRVILRNHPEAFVGDDINRLRVGAVIAKPTEGMLRGLPGD